jgi:hypothetical protein
MRRLDRGRSLRSTARVARLLPVNSVGRERIVKVEELVDLRDSFV